MLVLKWLLIVLISLVSVLVLLNVCSCLCSLVVV